jgi:predicted metal-dependent peptidase
MHEHREMPNNVDAIATERVLKARAELILSRRFYGVLVSNVEPVLSRKFPTMATNGRQHFYNPDFIATLTQEELLGVQAHESEHDARQHHSRRAGRDPELWNDAGDYSINGDLLKEGFALPKGRLYDPRFDGMSAEDIYRTLELDREKQNENVPSADDRSDDDDDNSDTEADAKSNDTSDKEGDDDGEESEESTEGEAEDEAEASDASDGADADGDDEASGADAGSTRDDAAGDGDDATDDASDGDQDSRGAETGEGDDDAAGEDGEGGKSLPQSSGDRTGCGEVIDAPEPDLEQGETRAPNWERIMQQAASMSRAVGEMPDHVAREIEASKNRPQDWREQMRAWFDGGADRIETWNRPNRRFIGRGLTLPGSQREGINKVVWLTDTSGSMDRIALGLSRTEVQAAMDEGIINELVVIACDEEITSVEEFRAGDDIVFDTRGGRGTDMKPAFRYIEEHHSDATLIINFTDLLIGDAGPEPTIPVLFAVFGYPTMVKQLMQNPPWGAPAIDVGAH